MRLEWKECTDPIFGAGFILQGLPSPIECARAYRTSKYYVAQAWIGESYLNHHGKTMRSAMKRLNTEIHRRSIGLFGVDDLEIVGP